MSVNAVNRVAVVAKVVAKQGGVNTSPSLISGKINPKAIAAMKELGYDLTTHHSKSLDEVKEFAPFDAVVTMGCGDACPWMPAKQFIDWQIPDPRDMNEEEFRKVRDFIREKVKDLLASLQQTN